MIKTHFDEIKTILCLGAHADDIEIGCGGTILKLLAANDLIHVAWVVLSARDEREGEAARSAEAFLANANEKKVHIKNFRDTFFPYQGGKIKEFFNELGNTISPDVIFTHRREDMHQDHRLVSELTWNTFRDHLILEYEIPKYEGDLGNPNVFMPLSENICKHKVEAITGAFQSQSSKHWFSTDGFMALLRIRGLESKSPSRFAEAFHCRKMII